MNILHCFADEGVESECLSDYGTVYRVGINPTDRNQSQPIQANAKQLPFDDVTFDLGLFHPPCTLWSDIGDANKHNDAENLIPLAREIAHEYCNDWIIENKPRAPLHDPTVLNGGMFGLPIKYERAFETSFRVKQPPQQRTFGGVETSPYFDSENSREWWASVKGYTPRYQKGHLSRNAVPRPALQYLLRHYWTAIDTEERADYSDFDKRLDTQSKELHNTSLTEYS